MILSGSALDYTLSSCQGFLFLTDPLWAEGVNKEIQRSSGGWWLGGGWSWLITKPSLTLGKAELFWEGSPEHQEELSCAVTEH